MSGAARAQAPEIELGLATPEQGPRVPAPFGRRAGRVSAAEACGDYRLIGVEDGAGPSPLPGQFYMLAAVDGWGEGASQRPYLARAFSVCRVRGGRLDFLVDGIGPGTARLARLAPGEDVWLVGPLGIGFSAPGELAATPGSTVTPDSTTATGPTAARGPTPPPGSPVVPAAADPAPRALLVGGGIGIAPLVAWEEALRDGGCAALALLGFRSAAQGDGAALFGDSARVATEDGSIGHHGLVTELLEAELAGARRQAVYACGPPAMLEAVRRICREHDVPAELAMEQAMACGFGACYGCVVPTASGYRRLCVDGPVVRAGELEDGWHS